MTVTAVVRERHRFALQLAQPHERALDPLMFDADLDRLLHVVDTLVEVADTDLEVAVAAGLAMALLGLATGLDLAVAVPLIVIATVITVADNGLAFTAVAERAGPFWSGRALGVQNTAQFLAAALVPPLGGLAVGTAGYAATFALAALFPLVAVPTTTGTGSESTTVCVLDVLAQRVKSGISHPRLRPTLAVVDPLLTITQPAGVTAAAGMDILCHALESYTALPYDAGQRKQPEKRVPYCGSNPISSRPSGSKMLSWRYEARDCLVMRSMRTAIQSRP